MATPQKNHRLSVANFICLDSLKIISLFITLLLLSSISGCAGYPAIAKVTPKAGSLISTSRVSVTQSLSPETYSIDVGSTYAGPIPGLAPLAVGLLIQAAATNKTKKVPLLTEVLNPATLRLQERFSEAARDSIASLGLVTNIIKIPQNIPNEEIVSYSKNNGSSDFLLILNIAAGYSAFEVTSPYYPIVSATASLRNVQTGEICYQEQFLYRHWKRSSTLRTKNSVMIKIFNIYDEDFDGFFLVDDITANPELARSGIIEGINPIVAWIGEEIRKTTEK